MLVADSQNNRVLGWKSESAFASGGAAALVIGHPDFNSSGCNQNAAAPDATRLCQPIGVAVDGAHRVYVGDAQNNRVLVFEDPFAALVANDQTSDFAADVNNNRALVFFSPIPMTMIKGPPGNFGDATADVAVGQPDLVSGACNQGGSATLASLCMAPFYGVGIAVDGGDNLYVADTTNNRALEYNGPFGYGQTNNVTADLVFEGNNLALPWRRPTGRSFTFHRSSTTRCTSTRSRFR